VHYALLKSRRMNARVSHEWKIHTSYEVDVMHLKKWEIHNWYIVDTFFLLWEKQLHAALSHQSKGQFTEAWLELITSCQSCVSKQCQYCQQHHDSAIISVSLADRLKACWTLNTICSSIWYTVCIEEIILNLQNKTRYQFQLILQTVYNTSGSKLHNQS